MEFTANLIASLVGGKVEGDGNIAVSTFAKIEEGRPGALSFLANPKYTHYIYTTESSIVLVANDFVAEQPIKATLIRVANPYETVSALMTKVAEATSRHPIGVEQPSFVANDVSISDDVYIGAFSYVATGAKIGSGVKIYPQVYVGEDVVLGNDTVLYPGVKIYKGCVVGERCIFHSGVVVGGDGFGFAPKSDGSYQKIPQMGIVEIGDDVEIGANTTIDRATMGCTSIARGTKLDNLIQVAHNVEIGQDTVIAAQVGIAGSAKVGSNCMIGGQVGVAGHIVLGDRVVVGAQSGIPNNVKNDSRIMGYPAIASGDFLRQAAYLRRLGKLFEDVKDIKQQIDRNIDK